MNQMCAFPLMLSAAYRWYIVSRVETHLLLNVASAGLQFASHGRIPLPNLLLSLRTPCILYIRERNNKASRRKQDFRVETLVPLIGVPRCEESRRGEVQWTGSMHVEHNINKSSSKALHIVSMLESDLAWKNHIEKTVKSSQPHLAHMLLIPKLNTSRVISR